jgi:hypothetical protein
VSVSFFGLGRQEQQHSKMVSNNDKASVTKEQNDKHKKVRTSIELSSLSRPPSPNLALLSFCWNISFRILRLRCSIVSGTCFSSAVSCRLQVS